MNIEQTEHKICLCESQRIVVVHPLFGGTSLSYRGELDVLRDPDGKVRFHIGMNDIAIIFTAEDVERIESDPIHFLNVYLKTPHSYMGFVPAATT